MKRFFTSIMFMLFFCCSIAFSQTVNFSIALDGVQANMGMGTGSNGSGSAVIEYDFSTNMLSIIDGTFSGLTSNATVAHIHVAPAGSNAPPFIDLPVDMATSGSFSGGGVLTEAEETQLFDNGMYINIHSQNFMGGEIRGQILAPIFSVDINGIQANNGNGTGSSGTGTADIEYDPTTNTVFVNNGSFSGLSGNATVAHIHIAPAGSSAGPFITLTIDQSTSGSFSGSGSLTEGQEELLFTDGMYINIHSQSVGGGEIRGQILTNNASLPIELSQFFGKLDNNNVNLYWETLTEINSDFFAIERSTSNEKFIPLKKMPAAGNSNNPIRYTFTDMTPFKGVNYYRLKQTDLSGISTYSKTIAIEVQSKEAEISVFPNPTSNSVTVQLKNYITSDKLQFSLVDQMGKTIQLSNFSINNDYVELNLENLSTGTYFFQIHNDQFLHVEKIIIQ